MITIRQLVDCARKELELKGIGEPQVHAELIAAFVLNKSRTYIKAFGDNLIYDKEEKLFNKILKEKLSGKPLAHIIGEAEFMGRLFTVGPTVLIPRPETEELVEQSVKHLCAAKPDNILDMCSGSGCIAVSLSFIFPSAKVLGADISIDALEIARKNADNMNLGSRVQFVQSDLFENIKGSFDLVISNPPYIPTEVIKTLSPEVQNEPHIALDGGYDGLKIIGKIIEDAPYFLNKGGLLALETGYGQAPKVLEFFKDQYWHNPFTGKDFAGIERFVFARKS